MGIKLYYYYADNGVSQEPWASRHAQILELLTRVRQKPAVSEIKIVEQSGPFPTDVERTQFLEALRDFSMHHHVSLGRQFGSNRYHFTLVPYQFVTVYEGGALREVFPCEIDRNVIEPSAFLESLACGEAWTPQAARPKPEKGKHADIVQRLAREPDQLEPGLTLTGKEVSVSKDFGELGRIDLVFKDADTRYLLVEVKVGPTEIAKAVGQVLMHRHLFASQNYVDEKGIRVGIACPDFPTHWQSVCGDAGILCFVVETGGVA